jgi:hypothetical protein
MFFACLDPIESGSETLPGMAGFPRIKQVPLLTFLAKIWILQIRALVIFPRIGTKPNY